MSEKLYRVQMNSKGMPNFSTAVEVGFPWHRVEEELPEIGKAVVVSIYGDMWVATRLDDKRFNGRMYWELSDGSWERVENDMYWMPIEPPKEEA